METAELEKELSKMITVTKPVGDAWKELTNLIEAEVDSVIIPMEYSPEIDTETPGERDHVAFVFQNEKDTLNVAIDSSGRLTITGDGSRSDGGAHTILMEEFISRLNNMTQNS